MTKKRLLLFHSAIAPYRLDFFNSLNEKFDAHFYFYMRNLISQKFETEKLIEQLNFKPNFLDHGCIIKIKGKSQIIRIGYLSKIVKHRPEIIILTEYNFNTILIILFCKIFYKKARLFTICDDSVNIASKTNNLRLIARKIALRYLDGLVLANYKVKKWYDNHFKDVSSIVFPIIQKEKRIIELLNSSSSFANIYIEKYNLKDKKILLYVGRLVSEKNLEFLLDTFTDFALTNRNTVLILVGEGYLRNDLLEFAKKRGIQDKVIFAGRFENEALYAWYRISDYFILPSTFEPFGAVVNEALIAGTLVICSQAAGAACLINETNGRLFDPNNKKDLLNVLNEFIVTKKEARNEYSEENSLMPYTYNKKIKELIDFINIS